MTEQYTNTLLKSELRKHAHSFTKLLEDPLFVPPHQPSVAQQERQRKRRRSLDTFLASPEEANYIRDFPVVFSVIIYSIIATILSKGAESNNLSVSPTPPQIRFGSNRPKSDIVIGYFDKNVFQPVLFVKTDLTTHAVTPRPVLDPRYNVPCITITAKQLFFPKTDFFTEITVTMNSRLLDDRWRNMFDTVQRSLDEGFGSIPTSRHTTRNQR
ncbi:MAG: hypothetical protein QY312_02725 [Candidatus Dojkabacteria bacterium]|nr:MAG: hypothetical protein QY312_02725 [Candidatus Dojkabacteria bacterium]